MEFWDSFVFLIPQGDNSKKTTTTTSSKNNNTKHNPKTEYNSIDDDDDDRSSIDFNSSCRVDSNRSIFVLFTSLQILLFQFNSIHMISVFTSLSCSSFPSLWNSDVWLRHFSKYITHMHNVSNCCCCYYFIYYYYYEWGHWSEYKLTFYSCCCCVICSCCHFRFFLVTFSTSPSSSWFQL